MPLRTKAQRGSSLARPTCPMNAEIVATGRAPAVQARVYLAKFMRESPARQLIASGNKGRDLLTATANRP